MTTDHRKIRKWIEDRGGIPSTVVGTLRGGRAGLLRVDYPGFSGEGRLKAIDWEDFFNKFDEQDLVFVYQDKTASGRTSRFSKFVARSSVRRRA